MTLCVRQLCPHSEIDYEGSLALFYSRLENKSTAPFLIHVHVYSRKDLWH